MKLLLPLSLLSLAAAEIFPLSTQGKAPVPAAYKQGDEIPIECIQRQIDNGEHKFDGQGNIIYGHFPVCSETGKPMALHYGVSQDVNCTVALDDTTYHLFQLYIHEDAPFSCRVGHWANKDAFIPFTLNFRGNLESSHLDIDTTLNVVAHKGDTGALVSAVGYASGTQTSRYIIGDLMTIQFSINWLEEYHKGSNWSHYKVSTGYSSSQLIVVSALVGCAVGALVYGVLYGKFNRKLIKDLGYKGHSAELGISKND